MSGDGLISAIACRPATFTIHSGSSGATHAERLQNKGFNGEAASLTIRGPGAVETRFLDCEGGYTVKWLARVSGDYTISLSLMSGENICGSPFTAYVSVPHADARRCAVSGIALNEAVAGAKSAFRVDFRDSEGRAVPPEPLDLMLQYPGVGGNCCEEDAAQALAGFITGGLTAIGGDADEGATRQQYAVNRAGRYELHVRIRSTGEALPGSPHLLTVTGGAPHAASTSLLGPRGQERLLPLHSFAGQASTLVFHAVDRNGNPCDEGGADVTASILPEEKPSGGSSGGGSGLGPPRGIRDVGVRDIGNGKYEVKWHGAVSGNYRLSVHMDGTPLGASPLPILMRLLL